MRPLVLVVEDEPALVTLLRYNLEREGFAVSEAHDGEEALLRARAFSGRTQLGQFRVEPIGAKNLTTAPATRVGDDFVDAVVDGDGTGIRLEREAATYESRRHAVTVPVKVQADIFVDARLHGIAIVVRNDRQRA